MCNSRYMLLLQQNNFLFTVLIYNTILITVVLLLTNGTSVLDVNSIASGRNFLLVYIVEANHLPIVPSPITASSEAASWSHGTITTIKGTAKNSLHGSTNKCYIVLCNLSLLFFTIILCLSTFLILLCSSIVSLNEDDIIDVLNFCGELLARITLIS